MTMNYSDIRDNITTTLNKVSENRHIRAIMVELEAVQLG
jgi:hypothetical protein